MLTPPSLCTPSSELMALLMVVGWGKGSSMHLCTDEKGTWWCSAGNGTELQDWGRKMMDGH